MRLSPRDYLTVIWHTCCAWSHFHAERFAEALECAKQAIDFNPLFPDSHAILTAAAAHLGQTPEAKAGLDGLLRLLPGLSITDPRLARPFRHQDGPRAISSRPPISWIAGVIPRLLMPTLERIRKASCRRLTKAG